MAMHETSGQDIRKYLDTREQGGQGAHAYAVLLGLRARDTEQLWARIGQGLSISAYERFQRNFELDTATLAGLLQTTLRTIARRKKDGSLLPRESDRLLSVTRIFARALDLFEGDREAALVWLDTAQPSLGERTPMEAIRTELGTVEVERLIERLEQGVYG